MTLQTILEALYSPDDDRVIEMINHSTPVTEFNLREKMFFIHSGFRFKLNTGKEFDLLIDLTDLSHASVIRQPCSGHASFPLILGLVLFRKIKFIDAFSKLLIGGISECNTKIYPIDAELEDITKNKLEHPEFCIFRDADNTLIKTFPLSRKYPNKLFQKGDMFFRNRKDTKQNNNFTPSGFGSPGL
ncbi:hypothetical protein SAMN05421813_11221 [Daejeonella rubra]|uniref:Uncharacterized protein n=1 Tax=Daejeonella rubra TaxID=990371 RepID=A0A1G9T642_9SPHI|nr:hypothetical protein [Daejeonella rubra]SDM43108.1 hypothetical protein SAMN05421813_11221 [Daejeonella rubra]